MEDNSVHTHSMAHYVRGYGGNDIMRWRKMVDADDCGREVGKPSASTITHKVGNDIAENHIRCKSLSALLEVTI